MGNFAFYKFTFYEKTGCSGNARQKELLKSYDISFDVKSLLDTKWTYDELSKFFENLEVKDMVNPFAPQIKNNEIDIKNLSKDEVINLMIKTPILIKRPLMEINGNKICGFDVEKINKILNLKIDTNKKINSCSSSDSCTNV